MAESHRSKAAWVEEDGFLFACPNEATMAQTASEGTLPAG